MVEEDFETTDICMNRISGRIFADEGYHGYISSFGFFYHNRKCEDFENGV